MATLPLAPTGKPSRWYSKHYSAQEEYERIKYMEAEFTLERERVLEFNCPKPFVGPSSTMNNIDNNNINNNNNHSVSSINNTINNNQIEETQLQDQHNPFLDDINIPITNTIDNDFNEYGNIDQDTNSLDRSHISPTYSPEPPFAFRSLVHSPSDRLELGNSFISSRASSSPINTTSSPNRLPNLFSSPPDIANEYIHSPFMRPIYRNTSRNNSNDNSNNNDHSNSSNNNRLQLGTMNRMLFYNGEDDDMDDIQNNTMDS